jgi:hypothetical protein
MSLSYKLYDVDVVLQRRLVYHSGIFLPHVAVRLTLCLRCCRDGVKAWQVWDKQLLGLAGCVLIAARCWRPIQNCQCLPSVLLQQSCGASTYVRPALSAITITLRCLAMPPSSMRLGPFAGRLP